MEGTPSGNFSDTIATSKPSSSLSPWWVSFVVICVLGILFNCLTFWKSRTTRKRGTSTTRLSLSLLCVMAGADTVCLVALLFVLNIRYLGITNVLTLTYACKMQLFVIHSASAFSLYCWLVLSLVRYIAVFSPYKHLRLHREPHLAVAFIACVIILLELYVISDVIFDSHTMQCMSTRDEDHERRMQIAEIIGTYFIPLVVITACDAKVLFFRATWAREDSLLKRSRDENGVRKSCSGGSPDRESIASEEGDISGVVKKCSQTDQAAYSLKKNIPRRRGTQMRALRRALLISIFDLLLNLPSYVSRLYFTVTGEENQVVVSRELLELVENVSQLLYFAQFSLNAFYLVCLIYDSPRKKRQIPVSTQNSFAASQGILSTQPSTKRQRLSTTIQPLRILSV